jgi:hypothetical protein
MAWALPLDPLAEAGVGDGKGEEGDRQQDEEDVEHGASIKNFPAPVRRRCA